MVDRLADAINRAQFAGEAAPKVDASTNPLGVNPMNKVLYEDTQGIMPRWQRVFATTLPEIGANIVSAPTALYGLADAGINYGSNKLGFGDTHLWGAEGANEITRSITEPVRAFSNKIAGEELSDNLLSGDPLQVAASWTRLLLGAGISAPAKVASKLGAMNSRIRAANATVGAITGGAGKVLEVLTPITISTKPSKLVAGTNMAVAGALGAGLEHLMDPQTTTVAQAKSMIDEKVKGMGDVAAEGISEVQRDPRMVQARLTGDPAYDAAGVAFIAAAAGLYWKRKAVYDATIGLRNGMEKHLTGYDPADPTNKTLLGFGTKFDQQNFSGMAGPQESLRAALVNSGLDKATAEKRAAAFGEFTSARTGASVNTRMQSIYQEGRLPDSSVKFTAVDDMYERRAKLNTEDQKAIDYALHSQREMDTRRISGVWHNLGDISTRELENHVKRVTSNPELNHTFRDFLNTTNAFADYTAEGKRFSVKEVKAFKAANPNFVPERLDEGSSYLNPRGIAEKPALGSTSGPVLQDKLGRKTFEELGSPFKHLPAYMDEVVRTTEGKKIQRGYLTNMQRLKDRGDTYATKVIGETIDRPGPNTNKKDYVHWRNQYGESKWTRVNDAVVRNALQGATNPTALQLASGFASKAARFYEGGSVGAAAAATGSTLFAPTSVLYNITLAPVIREKGVAMGYLDRYIQDASAKMLGKDKSFGWRSDPTFAVDAGYRMATNVAAVMTQRVAKSLHNSVLTNGHMAQMFGPVGTKKAADTLRNMYQRSAVYDLQQRGVLGPASAMSVDPAHSFRQAEKALTNAGLMGKVHGTASFVNDILYAISSAPAMSVRAMNKGRLPENELSAAMRNMTGDPARSGAFKKANGGTGPNLMGHGVAATPWGNIFVQTAGQFAKAIRKDPKGVASGIFNVAVGPAIGATIWAASLDDYVDPDTGEKHSYSDYQFNVRSPDKLASSVYIPIPGRPPEMGVEIPLDPLMRPFKYAGELIAGSMIGALDGSHQKPENADILKGLKDMVGHRQGKVWGAIGEQSILPPVSPIIKAPAALFGVDVRSYMDARAIDDKTRGGFSPGEGRNPQASFMDQYMPAQTEALVRSIGSGAAGMIYTSLVDASTRVRANPDAKLGALSDSAVNHIQDRGMRLKDNLRAFGSGPLFDSFLAISPSTEAAGSLVAEKIKGMQQLAQALQQSTLPGGVPSDLLGNKKIGFREPTVSGGIAPPPDLPTQQLAEMVTGLYKQFADSSLAMNKVLYEDTQGIRNSTSLSPNMKRAKMNENAFQIIQNNRSLLQDIERHEALLSGMFKRPIKFDKLQLGKTMEQQPQ